MFFSFSSYLSELLQKKWKFFISRKQEILLSCCIILNFNKFSLAYQICEQTSTILFLRLPSDDLRIFYLLLSS